MGLIIFFCRVAGWILLMENTAKLSLAWAERGNKYLRVGGSMGCRKKLVKQFFSKELHWLLGLKSDSRIFTYCKMCLLSCLLLTTIFEGSDKNCREVISFPLSQFFWGREIFNQM